MVQFNPQVSPTSDPNYLNLSKSITTPEADKSAQYAMAGASEGISGGFKAADTVVKQEIDSDVHVAVDKERDQYTRSLQYAESQVSPSLMPGADNKTTGDVPADLKSLPGAVSALTGARANGRLSETYYYGRLDSIAKDFRSRYPGYRDYIDQQISNITGVNPANAMVKSLIGDINAAQGSHKQEMEKTLSDLRTQVNKGNPDAAAEYDRVKATGDISGANHKIAAWNARGWRITQMEEDQKNNTMGDAERQRTAKSQFDLTLQNGMDQHWNSIQTGMGLNSPAKISQLLTKAAAGEINVPPEQKSQLLGQLTASRVQMEQDMRSKMYKPYTYTTQDLNGQPITRSTSMAEQLGGPKAAEEYLKASLGQWDTVTDLVTNDKYGLMQATKHLNEAILDKAQNGLLTDATIGPWLENLASINKLSPGYAEKYFAQFLANDMDKGTKAYIMKKASDMMAQPKYAENGIAETLKKVMQDAQDKGVTMPKAYNEYVKVLEPLWRTNIPGVKPEELQALRSQLAVAAFHPDNIGVLKSVQDDHWENGVHHPGAQTIYQRFGQQDAVNNMKSLTDPVHWENYVAFMGSEYTQMAKKDLLNLNDLTKNFPNVFYSSWDNEGHKWRLHQVGDTSGRDILNDKNFLPNKAQIGMSGLDAQFTQVQQSMKRLNMVTKPLVNVATADGGDANAAVLQNMMASGLRIDPDKPPQGLPANMIHNLLQKKDAATPASSWWDQGGDTPPAAPLQFAPQDNERGDLKGFLTNPGRALPPGRNNAPAASPSPPRGISNRQDDITTGPPVNIPEGNSEETARMMRGLPR